MKPAPPRPHRLIRKLRKPLAPPTRIVEDERKYGRQRERAKTRKLVNDPDVNGAS